MYKPSSVFIISAVCTPVGEKGQIVIPKEARTVFGIQPGDTLLVLGDETRGIVVTRPEVMRDVAAKIFDESDVS